MSDYFGSIHIDPKPGKKAASHPTPSRPIHQRAESPKSPQSKTIVLTVTGICLLAVCYFFAGIYLAPIAIEKYINSSLSSIGLQFSSKSIQLNPLTYQLTIKDITVSLPEESTTPPLLQIDSFFMDLDFTSLLRNGLVCDKLQIQALRLEVIRHKDKSYNLPDALLFNRQKHTEGMIDFARLPFLFSLNNISISDSRILFQDLVTDKTHVIEQLSLSIPSFSNFSFQSHNYITPHFSAVINGSPIQLSGKSIQVAEGQGFATSLSCAIQSLELAPYFSYLPPVLPFIINRGTADAKLQIVFSPEKKQGNRLSIGFTLNAKDIELTAKDKRYSITLPTLHSEGSLEPFTRRLYLKTIISKNLQITDPDAVLGHDLKNISTLLASREKAPQLAVDMLLIDNASFTARKDTGWQSIQIAIKDFKTKQWNSHSQKSSPATLRISGEPERGSGSFSWQARFTKSNNLQGELLVNNIPASKFFTNLGVRPAGEIGGKGTFKGDLTLFPLEKDSPYRLSNGSLQFNNLTIKENQTLVLKSPSVRIYPIERNGERLQLGNIFIKDANFFWHTAKEPPALLTAFFHNTGVSGVDFTGQIHVYATGDFPPLSFSNVRLQLNTMGQSAKQVQTTTADNFSLAAHLGENGRIKGRGTIQLSPFSLQATLGFADIESALFSPFYPDQPLLQNSRAILHGKGVYDYNNSSFRGDIRITDALLQRSADTPLFSWQHADATEFHCTFSPPGLTADTLLLDGGAFRWSLTAGTNDPFRQFAQGIQTILRNDTHKDVPFSLSIKEITLQNSTVSLHDERLSPPWSAAVTELTGKIKNFAPSSQSPSAFECSGALSGSAFKLTGGGTLSAPSDDDHAILQLTDFPLSVLQEQLTMLNINTEAATLNLQLKTSRQTGKLLEDAEIDIDGLLPDTQSADTALPLALLRDPENHFSISLQTKEKESLITEAANHFQTTVIRASYAPFILDRTFTDLQDNDQIPFLAGTIQFAPKSHSLLSRYLELLQHHPNLALVVTGMADRAHDQKQLQKQKEAEEQKRVNIINAQGKKDFQMIRDMVVTPPGAAPEDMATYKAILPSPVQVNDTELYDLADERTLVVYDFFLQPTTIDASRVTLGEHTKIIEEGDGNHVTVHLKPFFPTVEN